jgi:hypothetical protein
MFREMSPETFWLLCWSIGGLIVMSLIPSKRVDRIFPVIPPLCLLLAAQVAPTRVYRWSAIALAFAVFFTGGYTSWKIITGYRDHRDALAVFGRNIRHEAEAHHWRYEVVSAKDEGLLLYLRKTHFVKPGDAITEWNTGNLDALVASKEKAAVLIPDLKAAALVQSQSNEREQHQQGRGYILITR